MQLQDLATDRTQAANASAQEQDDPVALPLRTTPAAAPETASLPPPLALTETPVPQGARAASPMEIALGEAPQPGRDAPAAAAGPAAASRQGGVSCSVQVPQPAESLVTSVVGDLPRFSTTITVPFALIWAQVASTGELKEEQLSQVTSVVATGASRGAVGFTLSPDAITMTTAGLTAAQQTNAVAYELTLASGQQVTVMATATAFHTDIAEWKRGGLRNDMARQQDEIERFSAAAADDAALGKRPPIADVSGEQAGVSAATARLVTADAQLHPLEAALRARFEAERPELRALLLEQEGATSGVAPIEAQAQAFQRTADALTAAQQGLDAQKATTDNLRGALTGIGDVPPDLQRELADDDARVQALTAKRDALAAQLQTQQGEIDKLLDAQDGAWDRLLSQYQAGISDGDQTLSALLAARRQAQFTINDLQRTIASKQNEAVQEGAAATARAVNEQATAADAQKRVAADQAALAALKGPVFVTLGADGAELKNPAPGTAG